jgi:hypothetical protein
MENRYFSGWHVGKAALIKSCFCFTKSKHS